jgi:photosystem II stability/assembly factor-like uncharacterized protein
MAVLALAGGARSACQPAWTSIGPRDRTYIDQIVFDSRLPDVAYALNGGVMRSDDAGFFWQPALNRGLPPSFEPQLLAASPQGPLFALGLVRDLGTNGLFESADGAESWQALSIPRQIAAMCSASCGDPAATLAFDPRAGDTFYLAGWGGLFRTRDHGRSWQQLPGVPARSAIAVAVDPLSSRRLYAGLPDAFQGSGLYVSEDDGATWARVLRGTPTAIVVSPVDAAVVWAIRPGSIAESTDRGRHWSTVLDTGKYSYSCCGQLTPFVADATDSRMAFVSNQWTLKVRRSALRTGDGGRHWHAFQEGLPENAYILSMAQSPVHPTQLLIGVLGAGTFRSQDRGASWSFGGFGLSEVKVTALAVSAIGLLATVNNSVCAQVASTTTWNVLLIGATLPQSTALAVDPADPRTLYSGVLYAPDAGNGTDALFKSTDAGRSWEVLELPGATRVTDLVIDPHDSQNLYAAALTDPAGASRLFGSSDAGASWSVLAAEGGELAFDAGSQPATVFVANGSLLRSQDGGATWQGLPVVAGGTEVHRITHLALGPPPPAALYVLSEEGGAQVLSSTDGGLTWSAFSQHPPRTALPPPDSHHPMAVDPESPGVVYLGGSAGVFRSVDGAAWEEVGLGLPPIPVQTLLFSAGCLFIGTASDGVFALSPGPTPSSSCRAAEIRQEGLARSPWAAAPLPFVCVQPSTRRR